jgi:hypothetical protein
LLGSEELVRGAIDDLENCAFPEKEKALLRFVTKVNHRAWEITADEQSSVRRRLEGRSDLQRRHSLRPVQFLQPLD